MPTRLSCQTCSGTVRVPPLRRSVARSRRPWSRPPSQPPGPAPRPRHTGRPRSAKRFIPPVSRLSGHQRTPPEGPPETPRGSQRPRRPRARRPSPPARAGTLDLGLIRTVSRFPVHPTMCPTMSRRALLSALRLGTQKGLFFLVFFLFDSSARGQRPSVRLCIRLFVCLCICLDRLSAPRTL